MKDEAWAKSPAAMAERESIKTRLDQFSAVPAPEVVPPVADPTKKSPAAFKAMVQMMAFDPAPLLKTMKTPLLSINDEIVETTSTVVALEELKESARMLTIWRPAGCGPLAARPEGTAPLPRRLPRVHSAMAASAGPRDDLVSDQKTKSVAEIRERYVDASRRFLNADSQIFPGE